MRLPRPVLLGLLLTFPALAAGSWTSWQAAFPTTPCGDGWVGCLTSGGAMGPGLARDAAKRPVVTSLRVGWFDLQPEPWFSPFQGLSAYQEPAAGVAAVLADASAPPTAPPVAAPVDAATAQASTAPVGVPPVAPTVGVTGTTARPSTNPNGTVVVSNGTTTPPVAVNSTTPTGVTGTTGRPTGTTGSTGMITPPPTPTGTTKDAPTTAASEARTTTPPTASPVSTPSAPPVEAVIKVANDGCDDVVSLEPLSLLGQLSAGQKSCLEGKVNSDLPQTTRDKLSRVLIANAEARGDKTEWERLVRRHLEDIDRSDPDLCYKYALQLSRGGVNRANGVIRWADYGLENKQRWSGQTYKSRVYALLKLKAEAAAKLWQAAEQEYTTGEHTDENEAKATKLRGEAKDYAREWLDYARTSAQDTTTALSLCVSAAGNRSFCDGG